MSYAVIRIQKMTSGAVKGIQIHDQREKEYSHTNSDIDFSKSHMNEDLLNNDNVNFNHKIKDRIKELTLPKAVRKDAIVMCQCLITSDKQFFDKLSLEEQRKFFQDSFKFIKDRYGEKNLISATIHYDEKTPHMHVNFVPVTKDGRLCAKDLFKRGDLVKLHDDFHTHCKENGYDLERGENKGEFKKHLTVEEYKIETKRQEIENIKSELDLTADKIQNELNAVNGVLESISVLDDVKLEKVHLPLMKGKIVVSKSQYDENLALGKLGMSTIRKNQSLSLENDTLKNKNNEVINKVKSNYENEISELKYNFKELLQEKSNEINSLKDEIQNLNEYKDINSQLNMKISNLGRENKTLLKELETNKKALDKTLSRLNENVQNAFKKELEKEIKSNSRGIDRSR